MAFGDFVQSNNKDGTGASDTCAYTTANPTPGSLLTAHIRLGGLQTVTSVTDTRGNTWRQLRSQQHASDHSAELWGTINSAAAASANTVTVNQSGSGTLRIAVMEHDLTGVTATEILDLLDEVNSGTGTGTAVSSGSVTTTTADQIALGLVTTANQGIDFGGGGWNDRGPDGTPGGTAGVVLKLAAGEKVLTAPSTETVTATIASGGWTAIIATISKTSLAAAAALSEDYLLEVPVMAEG